jgi:hypothetical protein
LRVACGDAFPRWTAVPVLTLAAAFFGAAFFGAAFLATTFFGLVFVAAAFFGAAFLGAAFLAVFLGDRFFVVAPAARCFGLDVFFTAG